MKKLDELRDMLIGELMGAYINREEQREKMRLATTSFEREATHRHYKFYDGAYQSTIHHLYLLDCVEKDEAPTIIGHIEAFRHYGVREDKSPEMLGISPLKKLMDEIKNI